MKDMPAAEDRVFNQLNSMKLKYFLIGLILFESCNKAALPEIGTEEERGLAIPVSFVAETLEDEVKSSIGALALQQINNVNYYLFQNGSLKGQHYFEDAAEAVITLPDPQGSYKLYLLANCNEVCIPAATMESELGTAVHIDFGSRTNYMQCMASGVPMYGVREDFSASSGTLFTLRRLVHHIVINLNTDILEKTNMQFTSLKIAQAARDIYPFADGSRATAVIDGDMATQADLNKLNNGESVSFYVLENMRGDLISASSWKDKLPSAIPSEQERSLATYMELTARIETPTATYSETTYRTYLGLSPSNFDTPRNKFFTLTSVFTNEMVEDEGWRIEAGDALITGDLRFVGTQSELDDVEEFYLMKGFSAVYYVYRSNPEIDFTISADISPTLSPYVSFKTARVDDFYTAILFRTDRSIDTSTYYAYDAAELDDTEDVTLTLRSYDGLLSDSIKCKVINKAFGIRFFYSTAGDLRTQVAHPQGLAFYIYYHGSLKGSVSYKPNGSWGRTQTKTDEITVANAQSATSSACRTESFGSATRIDNYRYVYGYERASSGFIEYMREIWNMTGWDSYTALNGSNGYDKHAHPTQLKLDFTLSFTSLDPLHWHPDEDATFPLYYVQETPRIVYAGTTSQHVRGAGTDWYMFWDQQDKEGGDVLHMNYNISTYTVSGGSIVPGYTYEEGSDRIPIHVNINGTDNLHYRALPLTGQFQSIDFYADASNWK